MIAFDYRLPSPSLREFVKQFQIVGFEFGYQDSVPWKPYWPRPENCLMFYPRQSEIVARDDGHLIEISGRSVVRGQPYILTNRQPGKNFVLFQVVFQPGALFRLSGVPAHYLTHQFVDAEVIFSSELSRVNDRLSSTNDPEEMVQIVEQYLGYLIRRCRHEQKPIDRVALYVLQQQGKVSMDWLARESCLSRRQFYRYFIERMGISPKLFARITRFDQAIKFKNAHPHLDWLSIALQLGYYDYQHLARDFKEFTQHTPASFYLLDSHAPETHFGHREVLILRPCKYYSLLSITV
jgi:AraC-like DNA-binding protein